MDRPLRPGQRASRSLQLTDEHVELFAQLTGDRNPLHFDDSFAARTRFGERIVQGGLITGILNTVVAMDLPGPGSVFMEQQLNFRRPARPGDTITGEVEIVAVEETRPVARCALRVTRQDDAVLLEGTASVYVAEPRTEERPPGATAGRPP